MSLHVTAELKDESNRPLANVPVRVARVPLRGAQQTVAQGRTDGRGHVALVVEDPGEDPTPRLVLQAYVDNAYRLVAPTPTAREGERLAFGEVTVSSRSVGEIDGVAVYGTAKDIGGGRGGVLAQPFEPGIFDVGDVAVHQLRNQLDLVRKERDEFQDQLDRIQQDTVGLRDTLARLEGVNERLAGERDRTQAKVADLELTVRDVVAERDLHLADLRETKQRLEELEQQLTADQSAEIQVTDLFVRTGEQFTQVNDRLGQSVSEYRLGDVEVEMKVVLSADNQRARLPTVDDLAGLDAQGLTIFKAAFERPAASGDDSGRVTVPDVEGYGRALAERRLRGAGLRVAVLSQHVPSDRAGAEHGRVLEQQPSAGETVARGTLVELLVGRSER